MLEEWTPDPAAFRLHGTRHPDLTEESFAFCTSCRSRRWAGHAVGCQVRPRYEPGKSTCRKCRRVLDDPKPDDCEKCHNTLCGNCCNGAAVCPPEAIASRRAWEVLQRPPPSPSYPPSDPPEAA